MLYLERTVTVNRGLCSIDEPVILYKGDKNVEIQFYIKNNPFKSKANSVPTFGQLVIKRTKADSIFSDVAQLNGGKVLFVITAEMIDELVELGNYTFQIRLFNEDKSSRGTLPEIVDGIIIKKPICDGEEPAKANDSYVNESYAAHSTISEDTFDENGDYNATTWKSGDLISDVKLNKIENAISTLSTKESSSVDEEYINNIIESKGYITEVPSEYITEGELDERNYLKEIPEEYITSDELNEYGYAKLSYVDEVVGDIGKILDEINGEEI